MVSYCKTILPQIAELSRSGRFFIKPTSSLWVDDRKLANLVGISQTSKLTFFLDEKLLLGKRLARQRCVMGGLICFPNLHNGIDEISI
jgi:hypothetical protein